MMSTIMTMMLSITLMSLVHRSIALAYFQITDRHYLFTDPQVATVAALTNAANAILL
jgi:hypothetical protein